MLAASVPFPLKDNSFPGNLTVGFFSYISFIRTMSQGHLEVKRILSNQTFSRWTYYHLPKKKNEGSPNFNKGKKNIMQAKYSI